MPSEASVVRLVGAVLADVHDERQAGDCRYLSEGSMALLYPERDDHDISELTVSAGTAFTYSADHSGGDPSSVVATRSRGRDY